MFQLQQTSPSSPYMVQKKISAFPDGNSFVDYNSTLSKLIIANSEGLIKIFNLDDDSESEPVSIDTLNNVTSLSSYENKQIALTTTEGKLELIDLSTNTSKGVLFRSELPLRDTVFINQGNRLLCGGDENKLIIIDLQNTESENKITNITLPDQLVNISYNFAGELSSVSLSNGDVQIYSVVNEQPNLTHTIENIIPRKIHTSMDVVDFNEEHNDELLSTNTEWSSNGQYLLIPTVDNKVQVYDRSDWNNVVKSFSGDGRIVDFKLSSSGSLAILSLNVLKIYNFESGKLIHEDDFEFDEDAYPLNLAWKDNSLFVGSTNGETLHFENVVQIDGRGGDKLLSLFVSDAEDDDEEEDEDEGNNTDDLLRNADDNDQDKQANDEERIARRKRTQENLKLHEEDSLIIDEDDLDDDLGLNSPVSNGFHRSNGHQRKKFKSSSPAIVSSIKLKPYSPGSTPFDNKGASSMDRRYLTMNNIGYAWIVQNKDTGSSNSITVSFFDRSLHNEYHFTDYQNFDLASMNQRGILLGSSSKGFIFYRSHNESSNDRWERKLPLLSGEYITSICITDNQSANNTIVVGTSLGYLRFFNQFGVCINILKTLPIVTLVASSTSNLFMINQVTANVYSYSIIDINQDYKYIQYNAVMPLKDNNPLIKGIFFNELNDPCIVGGEDDTLLVLHSWREPNNAKWVPILNCHQVITEYGSNDSKKNWKCWPLGLINDKLNCLILKNNNNQYPGFPLPLPIELDLELPIRAKHDEDEAEENFLRSLTMGKLVSDSINNDELSINVDEDEVMERLNQYSILFDKSLLKLFGEACKESKLGKAFSIARLIKTDKALLAASRISERMEFLNLATKIGELRERLVDINDD